MSSQPHSTRPSSFRNRVANWVFVVFFIISHAAFAVGILVGSIFFGIRGFILSLLAGWIIGIGIRRSLGRLPSDASHAHYIRMLERGGGAPPGWLERFVEMVRGERLTSVQCRLIAAAHSEANRQLQTCDSPVERAIILDERNRKILAATRRSQLPVEPSEDSAEPVPITPEAP
jgi:hypothetical protein